MRKYSLWNTLKINFLVLPFKQAVKLPIYVGPNFENDGLTRGSIEIKSDNIHRKMILLGASRSHMYGSRGVWTHIRVGKGAKIILGGDNEIHQGVSIVLHKNARIEFGRGSCLNTRSLLYASERIAIGNYCMIGWNVQIIDGDAHSIYNKETNTFTASKLPIAIGNHVWIASGCSIRKGAALPDHSILGGDSLLTRDYSSVKTSGNIFIGSPAKLVATDRYSVNNPQLENLVRKMRTESGAAQITMPDDFNINDYLFDAPIGDEGTKDGSAS